MVSVIYISSQQQIRLFNEKIPVADTDEWRWEKYEITNCCYSPNIFSDIFLTTKHFLAPVYCPPPCEKSTVPGPGYHNHSITQLLSRAPETPGDAEETEKQFASWVSSHLVTHVTMLVLTLTLSITAIITHHTSWWSFSWVERGNKNLLKYGGKWKILVGKIKSPAFLYFSSKQELQLPAKI